ncbi:MAG: aminodeoxychorismate/anthranilate synthase component II [Alphaproteobacteria bacterium]|nr:aminodeoxychorismate/anthranilate synthase component II [Alphaproteobacteria bacterium]
MILVIDHHDSFVENLARLAREVKEVPTHILSQDASLETALALKPQGLILSPGPGTPDECGISHALLAHYKNKIPILGVCLGHQIIASAFGGKVARTPTPRHGKALTIHHKGHALFAGLAPSFEAGLYHSLCVKTLPPDFTTIATSAGHSDDIMADIMAMTHKNLPIFGVQFHPESILTPDGHIIIRNFLEICYD